MRTNKPPSKNLVDACKRLRDQVLQEEHEFATVEVGFIDPAMAQIAKWQEYGWVQRVTKKQTWWFKNMGGVKSPPKAGSSLVLPPRPFMRDSCRAYADKWSHVFANEMRMRYDMPSALIAVGKRAQEDIQDTIKQGGTPDHKYAPRSKLTQELYQAAGKGHKSDGTGGNSGDKPLFRSGQMYGAVSYQLGKR